VDLSIPDFPNGFIDLNLDFVYLLIRVITIRAIAEKYRRR
jgi:hypothetical protein